MTDIPSLLLLPLPFLLNTLCSPPPQYDLFPRKSVESSRSMVYNSSIAQWHIKNSMHRILIMKSANKLSFIVLFLVSRKKHNLKRWDFNGNIRLSIIIACTISLSNLVTQINKVVEKGLDDGSECQTVLLRCLSTIMVSIRSELLAEYNSKNRLLDKIGNHALGGKLVAGLVYSCLKILEPLRNSQNHAKISSYSTCLKYVYFNFVFRENMNLQLIALRTLGFLLNLAQPSSFSNEIEKVRYQNDTIVGKFKDFLPGLFLGLFKNIISHLRYASAHSSLNVTNESLRILSLILKVTISSPLPEKNLEKFPLVNSTQKFWDVISIYKQHRKYNIGDNRKYMRSISIVNYPISYKKYNPFLERLFTRISGPLKIIFLLIQSHWSVKVKRAGIEFLCRNILVYTCQTFWDTSWQKRQDINCTDVRKLKEDDSDQHLQSNNNQYQGIIGIALEFALMMSVDEDDKTSLLSRKVILSHRQFISNERWKYFLGCFVIPRTMELLYGLPTIAQTGRETDLRLCMNLVAGYLSISYGFKSFSNRNRHINVNCIKMNNICCTLAGAILGSNIKSNIAEIFSFDESTTMNSNKIVLPTTLLYFKSLTTPFQVLLCRQYMYMREDSTIKAAKNMVDAIVHVLRIKQTSTFIDACITDVFITFNFRINDEISVFDKLHSIWLRESQGKIVLSNELLLAMSSLISRDMKNSKVMSFLAASIIPVLTSDPLWNLPTTLELVHIKCAYDSVIDVKKDVPGVNDNYSKFVSVKTLHEIEHVESSSSLDVSIEALNANAIFTAFIIEIIGNLFPFLESDINRFIPNVLYLLLLKTSDVNHFYVQQSSLFALGRITTSLGRDSTISVTILHYFNHLMDNITSELCVLSRLSSSSSTIAHRRIPFILSMHRVIEFILISVLEEDFIFDSQAVTRHKVIWPPFSSSFLDMIDLIVIWFNHEFDRTSTRILLATCIPFGLARVFNISAQYLLKFYLHCFQDNVSSRLVAAEDDFNTYKPWVDILLQFKLHVSSVLTPDMETNGIICARDGFLSHLSMKCNIENYDKSEEKICYNPIKKHTMLSMNFIKRLLKTSKYMMTLSSIFLSISDLRIQKLCCDMLSSCFQLFSAVEKNTKVIGVEEDIGNPLLTSVNEFWSPIEDCLDTAVFTLMNIEKNNAYKHKFPSRCKLEVLITNLLDLISLLSELAGDFMVDYFRGKVYSIILIMLRYTHTQISDNLLIKKWRENKKSCSFSRIYGLILAILNSISFSYSRVGSSMGKFVDLVESIIIPLLGDDGEVGVAATETVKNLLKVDNSSFIERLLITYGKVFPVRPLIPTVMLNYDNYTTNKLASERAKELLEYVKEIPEQLII